MVPGGRDLAVAHGPPLHMPPARLFPAPHSAAILDKIHLPGPLAHALGSAGIIHALLWRVAALNPHASDGGLSATRNLDQSPAVAAAA